VTEPRSRWNVAHVQGPSRRVGSRSVRVTPSQGRWFRRVVGGPSGDVISGAADRPRRRATSPTGVLGRPGFERIGLSPRPIQVAGPVWRSRKDMRIWRPNSTALQAGAALQPTEAVTRPRCASRGLSFLGAARHPWHPFRHLNQCASQPQRQITVRYSSSGDVRQWYPALSVSCVRIDDRSIPMKKTLALLSLAALLASGGAAMAANAGNEGQQTPAPQNTPATGSAPTVPPSTSAQSTGAYPGAVGPSGSTQPDATNPVRSNPSGGGGQGGGSGTSR
jgi:hypothetical protein